MLLCRLYEPTEGRILLNGVDIREYGYEEYLALFGVVFQDFKLFAVTVAQKGIAGHGRNLCDDVECTGTELPVNRQCYFGEVICRYIL